MHCALACGVPVCSALHNPADRQKGRQVYLCLDETGDGGWMMDDVGVVGREG